MKHAATRTTTVTTIVRRVGESPEGSPEAAKAAAVLVVDWRACDVVSAGWTCVGVSSGRSETLV